MYFLVIGVILSRGRRAPNTRQLYIGHYHVEMYGEARKAFYTKNWFNNFVIILIQWKVH